MADTTESAQQKPDAVLDLDTLIERPKIRIDGKLYEILSHDELSAVQSHRLTALGRRVDELNAKKSLSDRDKAKLLDTLTELTDEIMVGVPAEVRNKLSDASRLKVAEVFTRLPLKDQLARLVKAGAAIEAAAKSQKTGRPKTGRSIGAKPPRGSNGSTAARPGGGSTKRRSPSSGRT